MLGEAKTKNRPLCKDEKSFMNSAFQTERKEAR